MFFGKSKENEESEVKTDVVDDTVESAVSTDDNGGDGTTVAEVKPSVNDWFEDEGRELVRRGTGIKTFILRCAAANGVEGNYGEIVNMIGEAVAKQDFEAIAEKLSK